MSMAGNTCRCLHIKFQAQGRVERGSLCAPVFPMAKQAAGVDAIMAPLSED